MITTPATLLLVLGLATLVVACLLYILNAVAASRTDHQLNAISGMLHAERALARSLAPSLAQAIKNRQK